MVKVSETETVFLTYKLTSLQWQSFFSQMKKMGFLFVGIVVVMVILSLQNIDGLSAHARRIIRELANDLKDVVVEVYQEIQSFSTGLDGL